MKPIIVFYAGMVLLEFYDDNEFIQWRRAIAVGDSEIYNGAWVYYPDAFRFNWGRMDGTPALLEDVPKELRLAVLLMS